MNNKTAMQELIETLKELQLTKGVGYWCIDAAVSLLEKEKQQIIDSFEVGINKCVIAWEKGEVLLPSAGENYYNKTFNNDRPR